MSAATRLHAAAQVLVKLTAEADIPPIWAWSVRETGLEGQLHAADDTEVLHDLADAARAIGAPPEIQQRAYDAHPTRTRVWVTAQVDGIEVEIWSAVRTTSLPEGGAS